MRLPVAPPQYNRQKAQTANGIIERADSQNHKRNRDIEVGVARIILTSPDGTRYALTVANDGTVGSSAV